MPFDQQLAERVRKMLPAAALIEEKMMMGGLVFMVNGKMCVGISRDELMVRCDPSRLSSESRETAYRQMTMAGRPMRNFFLVDAGGLATEEDLAYWLGLALDFNATAKRAKKRR